MKKIILVLGLCLVAVFSKAQQLPAWKCHTTKECIALADSLLQDTKRSYEPDTLRFPTAVRGNYLYYYLEKDQVNEPCELILVFRYYMEGKNESLEIEGIPTYRLDLIQGSYLDLFPIWHKHIDNQADQKRLTDQKGDTKINETFTIRYIFEPFSDGVWRIYR